MQHTRLAAASLAALALAASTSAFQLGPGEVSSHVKISRTTGGPPTPQLSILDQFGRACAGIGDVDGDGVPDLAVGAHGDDDGGTLDSESNVGAVYILFLKTNGAVKSLQKISATSGNFTGTLTDDLQWGRAVGSIGDFDRDGVPDIAVGSPRDDDGGPDRGAIWLLYLNRDGTVKSNQKISSTQGGFGGTLLNGDEFGRGIADLGDLDGDGVKDFVVSATNDNDGARSAGALWVLFMNANGTVKSEQKISATQGGFTGTLSRDYSFGMSVTRLGDIDGDGVMDIATGAIGDPTGGAGTGAAWVLRLNSDGTVKGNQLINYNSGGLQGQISPVDEFGFGIAGPGDLDGDGVADMAVGSILDDDGGMNRGAVWVLFLRPDGYVKSFQKISDTEGNFSGGLNDNDWWGSSVTSLGDVNGDGITDLAAGARFDSDAGSGMGAVYVMLLNDGRSKAPSAEFLASTQRGDRPLTVDFYDSSLGNSGGWFWDFGDGATSASQHPTHTYTQVGSYTVQLQVSGPGGGDTETKQRFIIVDEPPPIAAFSADPTSGIAPFDVAFSDASVNDVTAWTWDFGDGGSSTEANPIYTYSIPGTYDVTLTVTGQGGTGSVTQEDQVVVIWPAPVAEFSGLPTAGDAPLAVSFADLSTGALASWSWDFGDGGSSTAQDPAHTYALPGTYAVTLTSTGPGGVDVESKSDYVVAAVPLPPTAEFSVDLDAGIAPLTTQFTDLSTSHIASWSWDFGDGSSSTGQNPSHLYTVPGTYSVTLTATGLGGSDTETKADLISVAHPPPVAAFDGTPTTGDAPLTVAFSDLSVNDVSTWVWDFGDGTSSSLQNPSHTYQEPGTYTVALSVTGAGGSDASTLVDHVTVTTPPPLAALEAYPKSGLAPLVVSFSDLSAGYIDSWSWDFGDGSGSTLTAPAHTYQDPGTYTVALSVTGAGGTATATLAEDIVVGTPPPVVDFSGTPLSGERPLSVSFSDLSSSFTTSWAWDFGDGSSSKLQHPAHTYTTFGTFTVTLTGNGVGGTDVESKVGYVTVSESAPEASFSTSETLGLSPFPVVFSDLSVNDVTTWNWDFGDGGTSTLQNPTHTYADAGTYTVTLDVRGAGGADSEAQTDLIVVDPPAPATAFSGAPTSGFEPLQVSFGDLTTGIVSSWTWSFGDGVSSILQSPTHTYLDAGTYTVALTATGIGGATTTTLVDYVTVLEPPPAAAFDADPTRGVIPLSVTFDDLTSGDVSGWSWDFGDGSSSGLQNPTHTYTDPGTYTVSLISTGAGGSDTQTQTDLVVALHPVPGAGFSGTPTTGDAPLTVQFSDLSSGDVASWSWDFGDGSTSNQQSPDHTYSLSGSYTVSLTVSGPGGADALTLDDYVSVSEPPPEAGLSATPTSGLAPLTVSFTDLSTWDVATWSWDFGDGASSSERDPEHVYSSAGTYDVTLTVVGSGGSDSVTRAGLIQVDEPPPSPAFSADPATGVAPLPVSFTDLTTGDVSSWLWDFGDGATDTRQNPTHTYSDTGTYTVTLTAGGSGGWDASTRLDAIVVAAAVISDGSFEGQTMGALPGAPWTVMFGTDHLIQGSTPERDMPSDGTMWCDISAEGTVAALPPTVPGDFTDPALGGAGVSQRFSYPEGMATLELDATFLRNSEPSSSSFNDWMSIDISDGVDTFNLYYQDTFSPVIGISRVHGMPVTGVAPVSADLSAVFPDSTTSTVFSLTIQVGNGGDGLAASRGYVDNVRLTASAGPVDAGFSYYGCDVNPPGTLFVTSGEPTVGATVTFSIDNPLGTQPVGSRPMIAVSYEADPQYPCGSLVNGWGMGGPGQSGELLVSLAAPDLVMRVGGTAWMGAGNPAPVVVTLPSDLALVGTSLFVQGILFDPAQSLGIKYGLTEAIEITLGP